jgi:hypothetical protein
MVSSVRAKRATAGARSPAAREPFGVFISYRRADSREASRAIYERLKAIANGVKVFIDIEALEGGDDFGEVLRRTVKQSSVCVAVIGPDWAGAIPPGRRLDSPDDFVRMEVATALRSGLSVIPVLLDRTPMPTADELPVDLRPLVSIHAIRLDFDKFDRDVIALVDKVRDVQGVQGAQAGSRRRVATAIGAVTAGLAITATAAYAVSEPLRDRVHFALATEPCASGFVKTCSGERDQAGATWLRKWPAPLVWSPGSPALTIPAALSSYDFAAHKSFHLAQGQQPNKADVLAHRDLDETSKKILTEGIAQGLPPNEWFPAVGLLSVHDIVDHQPTGQDYLALTYLAGWQRPVFSLAMIQDYYRNDGKQFGFERWRWFNRPKISFPSFLFSEFVVVTNDPHGGLAVQVTKTSAEKGSLLAQVRGAAIRTATAETAVRVGSKGDLLVDAAGKVSVNLLPSIERGLREIGIETNPLESVRLVVNVGVAFQEPTMNSALISIVWLDLSCKQIKELAIKRNLAVVCLRPDLGGDRLGRSEAADAPQHPTSNLRLDAWMNSKVGPDSHSVSQTR